MMIETALNQYFQEARSGLLENVKSQVTIKNSELTWKVFLKRHPLIYMEEFTPELFRSYLHYLEFERKLAPMTIKTYRKNLSVFLYWCVSKRYIPDNPLKGVRGPKIKHDIPKYYTDDQVEKVMRALDLDTKTYFEKLRNKAMFTVLTLVGLRRGELLNLKVADINFEVGTLLVQASTSKSRTSRVIPMPIALTNVLRDYIMLRKEYAHVLCSDLWVSSRGDGRRFTEHGFKHLTERLTKVVGFQVRPHWFRHTCATYAYADSRDIVAVQKMLGHSDISTTMIYTNALLQNVRQVVESSRLNPICF